MHQTILISLFMLASTFSGLAASEEAQDASSAQMASTAITVDDFIYYQDEPYQQDLASNEDSPEQAARISADDFIDSYDDAQPNKYVGQF